MKDELPCHPERERRTRGQGRPASSPPGSLAHAGDDMISIDFILHPSSFILHPSSLIPHPSNSVCYTRVRRPMKEKREIYRFLHVTPRRIFEQLDQFVI